MYVGDLP